MCNYTESNDPAWRQWNAYIDLFSLLGHYDSFVKCTNTGYKPPIGELLPLSPAHVLADRPAFFLGQG